jgi:hypothetical protein
VTAALAARARAVSGHDRAAFRAGLSGASASGGFREAQESEYANLAGLSFSTWSYSVVPGTVDAADLAAARTKYGRPVRIVHVTLRYALRGFDAHPTSHDQYLTFVRDGSRTVLAGDDDLAADDATTWSGPWDFGPLDVVHGAHSLVLGHPADATFLRSLAAQVDAAVPVVSGVWGTAWPRSVVVLVPASAPELAADSGSSTGITSSVAAVTVSDSIDALTRAALGSRLVVNRTAYERLTAAGRGITVRHEVTHVAAGTTSSDAMPRWLVEGFAEYVGNLGSGLSVPASASELAARVRAGKLPAALPTDDALTAGGTAGAIAYEQSWLACRLVAARVGAAGLVRLYRAVASSYVSSTALGDGLRSVLHESTATFVASWRAYLKDVLL